MGIILCPSWVCRWGGKEEEEVSFKGGQWVSANDAWQFGAAFLKGV